jgi:hypothetical protein
MEWKGTLKIPGYTIGISTKLFLKPREGTKVIGVCNKIGHFYTPFFDYDIKIKKIVVEEITSLQEEFLLGDAYLFKTGKGYHVIMLDLLTREEWLTVLGQSSCDEDYKAVPQHNNSKTWILRLTEKRNNVITYDSTIQGYLGRQLSGPHLKLLGLRGVPEENLKRVKIYSGMNNKELLYANYEA